eukprot:6285254-Prorocentrum_lima.AAC.1
MGAGVPPAASRVGLSAVDPRVLERGEGGGGLRQKCLQGKIDAAIVVLREVGQKTTPVTHNAL